MFFLKFLVFTICAVLYAVTIIALVELAFNNIPKFAKWARTRLNRAKVS